MDLGIPKKILEENNIPTEELPNEEEFYQKIYDKIFTGEGRTEEAKVVAERIAISCVLNARCLIRNYEKAALN